MTPSKQKRTHAVFRASSAHRSTSTSKPRFVGEKVRLGDVCTIVSGATPKTKTDEYWDGEIKWITPAELNSDSHYISDTEKHLTVAGYKSASLHMMPKGTVLLTTRAPIGKIAITTEEMCCNQGFKNLVCSSAINNEYLFLYLKSRTAELQAMGRGATFKELSKKNVAGFEINLPAIDRQLDAVAKLTAVESQIARAKQQLDQFDSLVKSRFVEMFENEDYRMRPMGDLVESITAGTNVGGQQRPLEEGEYGVLKISAVTQGVFNPGEFKVVDDVSRIKMIHPRKGDLLFSRANTTEMVGATAIVDKDYGDLFLPDKLWRLDPADEVETVFLKALLSSPSIRAEMSKVSTGSSGSMQNISMAKFRKLPAFLPPLALQQEFAAFVSQVDKSRFVRDHEMNFRWERFTLSWSTIA